MSGPWEHAQDAALDAYEDRRLAEARAEAQLEMMLNGRDLCWCGEEKDKDEEYCTLCKEDVAPVVAAPDTMAESNWEV